MFERFHTNTLFSSRYRQTPVALCRLIGMGETLTFDDVEWKGVGTEYLRLMMGGCVLINFLGLWI